MLQLSVRAGCLGILLFSIFAPASRAAERIATVAVLPFQSRGLDSNSTRILEDALSDRLAGSGRLRLLERSQIKTVLVEQGFQQSGACEGSECAVQIGRLLGVERGIVGSVGRLGRTYVLNARLIDIGTGEVVSSSQRSLAGRIDDALTDLVPLVAADLLRSRAGRGERAKGGSGAGWWVAGAAVVAGGAAVAYLFLDAASPGAPDAPARRSEEPNPPTGSLTFVWD
ncbi:MAG TPA: CsgG/HfaB family protein [Fibrobacteria bacterium]|nr:CsgG/HfaB family protein [Fibrobacteria bacterium]